MARSARKKRILPKSGGYPSAPDGKRKVPAVAEAPGDYRTILPRVRKTLVAGRKGTQRLTEQFGDRLLCVRHRYDPERSVRLTTVEIIVAQAEWDPYGGVNPSRGVGVRVGYGETELRERIKAAGARWDPSAKLWKMTYKDALRMRLLDRGVMP